MPHPHSSSPDTRPATLAEHSIAASWGFAEATVFFIVPDAYTSWAALNRPKAGMQLIGSALAGALAGGAADWWLVKTFGDDTTHKVLIAIPGIDAEMAAQAAEKLSTSGWKAFILGPLVGVPYKIFARQISADSLFTTPDRSTQAKGFWPFMAASIPARVGRFIVVTGGIAGLGALGRKLGWSKFAINATFAGGWTAFYCWYLSLGPGGQAEKRKRARRNTQRNRQKK